MFTGMEILIQATQQIYGIASSDGQKGVLLLDFRQNKQ
jgi:hypothetical protein